MVERVTGKERILKFDNENDDAITMIRTKRNPKTPLTFKEHDSRLPSSFRVDGV